MNVMGQLIDKAKRNVAMRTITNEKSPQTILPIRILEFEAKIENRPTILDEKSPAVLKYRTPHFRYRRKKKQLKFILSFFLSELQQRLNFLH
jgi:hypothetical protein